MTHLLHAAEDDADDGEGERHAHSPDEALPMGCEHMMRRSARHPHALQSQGSRTSFMTPPKVCGACCCSDCKKGTGCCCCCGGGTSASAWRSGTASGTWRRASLFLTRTARGRLGAPDCEKARAAADETGEADRIARRRSASASIGGDGGASGRSVEVMAAAQERSRRRGVGSLGVSMVRSDGELNRNGGEMEVLIVFVNLQC